MENKDLYKKAVDEIHAPNELKRKTLNKIENKSSKMQYMKLAVACACFMFVIALGIYFVPENHNSNNMQGDFYALDNSGISSFSKDNKNTNTKSQEAVNLQTFKDIDELKSVLKENNNYVRNVTKGTFGGIIAESALESEEAGSIAKNSSAVQDLQSDYSTTNVQVEGVDEADIIKTDGKYIYYVTYNVLYIFDATTLEELTKINYNDNDNLREYFSPQEIYLAKNKLVVLGNYSSYGTTTTSEKRIAYDTEDVAVVDSKFYAKAIIYDVSNPKDIKVDREIKIDGSYTNSRMIGNNLYFISTKSPIYYDGIKDVDILPSYEVSNEQTTRYIPANKIVYFPNTRNYNYVIIAGVDITKEEDISVESFFGSWTDKIYASENNLYIPITSYWYQNETNEIYKFKLDNSKVEYIAKGTFEGYLDSQFSIDEYNGFLRIATTSGYDENSTNTLYIFDSNLEEVSKLTDIAKGERIYSVRFMGKVGYIVTFEQIDPLFVVDLSDPYNPKIKGELEMPGYSSYLHPYDETHIIGIGYNVKSNGYGGVVNTSMKMAMFDVSDLENPKEMFSINIGDEHVYTELNNNHKALFYSKTKNLIGFPIQTWSSNYGKSRNNFTLYDIDLEKGFTEHGKIDQIQDYRTDIKRAIYINDYLYTIAEEKFTKYDLNTFEKINELDID